MIGAGRVGSVGGSRGRVTIVTGAPDFILSNASVVTTPTGQVLVGEFTIINAPPGCTIRIKETAGPSGDETGLAVVNG